jgi:SOS-response transcriptional repressor LexA
MKTNEEIISHVNDLMNLNNINASELSRRVKVSKSTMSRYLNGSREFPINKAHDFARALNTTTADLIGLETKTINEVTITELPYYGAVAAGNFEQGVSAGGKIEIPSSIIKESKENYFVLKANGDSMNKVIANDHYVVVKDLTNTNNNLLKTNDIVIAKNGNEYTMKRIRRTETMVHLEPDSYIDEFITQSFEIDDLSELEIIGKVVYSFREYN